MSPVGRVPPKKAPPERRTRDALARGLPDDGGGASRARRRPHGRRRRWERRTYEALASGFEGVTYLSLAAQRELPFESIPLTPERHFGRKNIGYLYATWCGAHVIFDFDSWWLVVSENRRRLIKNLS